MTLTILEILYIVLIMFTSIIGTLLVLVLVRAYKILGPIVEILEIYNKIKNIITTYSKIPDSIKQKMKDGIKSNKDS